MNADFDLSIENHGSIIIVRPETTAAKRWLRDTAPEDAQFFGPGLVVEPRYLSGVLDAAAAAGLNY